MSRTCEHCGSDTWEADNFQRVVEENRRLRKELELEASRHAITKALHRIEEIEREGRTLWLQRKVDRQRRRLRAFEEARLFERPGMLEPQGPPKRREPRGD